MLPGDASMYRVGYTYKGRQEGIYGGMYTHQGIQGGYIGSIILLLGPLWEARYGRNTHLRTPLGG